MYRWPHSDLVAAVTSIVGDAARCQGCGLTGEETRWVAAELVSCPACEDRDRQLKQLESAKERAGWRATFRALKTVEESVLDSSAARYTKDGAVERHRWIKKMRS